jgi:glutamate-1-semialdehyde 2,1-aminomutase
MDEVSFHMSGTEAVMQAVRLARYHTRRTAPGPVLRRLPRLVGRRAARRRQPAAGARDLHADATCTSARSRVLRTRRDIACVLVNPLQALHPNPPRAGRLLAGRQQPPGRFRPAGLHATGCKALRKVCTERGIVLIFDEVFLGFRLAPGGAQEYFGVQADMVTYGKTLGGGLPVGVLCGRADADAAATATIGRPTSASPAAPSIRIPT